MSRKSRSPAETYKRAVQLAQSELPERDPRKIESFAGAAYEATGDGSGIFRVPFLQKPHFVQWPGGKVTLAEGSD